LEYIGRLYLEKKKTHQAWWLTPVISTRQEAEIWRLKVGGKPRQKVSKTPS
jgi:inorganic triphosphatase YgiF